MNENERACEAVQLLVAHVRDDVLGNLDAGGDAWERAVLAALFSHALSCAEAALVLARAGYGREVIMLSRPAFELMLDAHWARANPDEAKARFVKYSRFSVHIQRAKLPNYAELGIDELPGLEDSEVAELTGLFGTFGQKGWTGLTIKERVQAIAEQFEAARQGIRLLWGYYDFVNALANAELHSGSWSLARAIRRVETPKGERLQLRTSPEDELVSQGLGAVWWSFGHLLSVVEAACEIPIDRLQQAMDQGAELLGFERLDADS